MFNKIKVLVKNRSEAKAVLKVLSTRGLKMWKDSGIEALENYHGEYPFYLLRNPNGVIGSCRKDYITANGYDTVHISEILAEIASEYFINKRFIVRTDEECELVFNKLEYYGFKVNNTTPETLRYDLQYIRVGAGGDCWDGSETKIDDFIAEQTTVEPLENLIGEPVKKLNISEMLDNMVSNGDIRENVEAVVEDTSVSGTNPKAAIGAANMPMSMVSPLFKSMVALGKLNGSLKYGRSNYLGTQVQLSIYIDAIERHLDKIKSGEWNDIVDNVPHLGAIGANCDIIASAQAAGTLINDLGLATGQLEAMARLVPTVRSLHDLHKDKNPKHYYIGDIDGLE